MAKTLANVKGLGRVVEVCSDFYSELQELKEAEAELISPRDEAYARIKTAGKENIGIGYGTWTSAGFEHVKGERPLMKLNSRLLAPELAKQAVEANRQGNYFHTETQREYEESLKQAELDKNKDPLERQVVILPSRENFEITSKQNWEIAEFALKDQAKDYIELNGYPITVYPVDKDTVDTQGGTLLTQMWFRDFAYRSGFGGDDGGLYFDYRARGVSKKTAESGSQKILPYSPKQLDEYLEIAQGVRTGELPASRLEQLVEFLEGLKE